MKKFLFVPIVLQRKYILKIKNQMIYSYFDHKICFPAFIYYKHCHVSFLYFIIS